MNAEQKKYRIYWFVRFSDLWISFLQKTLATGRRWEVRMFAGSWKSFWCLCNRTVNSDNAITGHLPREISRVTKLLLDRGAVAYAELTSTHYRRSQIMQGGLEMLCKVTVKLHGTVKKHMLLSRYMQLVNSLYCEPKEAVILGSLLTKTQLPASRIATSSVKKS